MDDGGTLFDSRIRKPAGGQLQRYFSSGWIFIIPYLALYILYATYGWPVHRSGDATTSVGLTTFGLPLLQVYWMTHAGHALLAGVAFWRWWKQHDYPMASLRKAIPWCVLALWFLIPGVYLEYPADTWEHYRRIIAWDDVTQLNEHYSWRKWSYFFAYTFIGAPAAEGWLSRINLFATGVSLLLCWQYYKLARALGIGPRSSTIFVFVQTLMLGNHLFSFYRYYGLSSSPFAQVGALALIRMSIEFLLPRSRGPFSVSSYHESSGIRIHAFLQNSLGICALLALIAYNHPQGLIIAAMGIAAVGICWLISLSRSVAWILLVAVILLNLISLFAWPRGAVVDSSLREAGWLSSWYGFALLGSTPAGERAFQILGLVGLANLAAAILLVRRNHLVGWLTLAPVIILCLPAFAIPFANALVAVNPGNIVSFHRVLFAIPPGLALIVLVENFLIRRTALISARSGLIISLFFWVLVLATVIVPPGRFAYNRLYNLFAVAPADLSLAALTAPSSGNDEHPTPTRSPLLVPRSIGFVLETRGFSNFISYYRGERHIAPPRIPAKELNDLTYVIRFNKERQSPITVWIPPATDLWTPASLTALISNHWIPQQVALDRAGKQEVDRTLEQ